jgi:hypothetical protein
MSLLTTIRIARRKHFLSSIGNPVERRPLSWYVGLLAAQTPFSFSRFGDGEWSAIFGAAGANCDGHEYFPELGRDLRDAIVKPLPYFYAMQPRALKTEGARIAAFLSENGIRMHWHDSDVFHEANRTGRLYPLVDQLRRMTVVLIGPASLRAIDPAVFPVSHFIEIPPVNCYEKKHDILSEIVRHAETAGASPVVYAFSASMTANVLIHDLYPRLGDRSWFIDFGSLWDVYAGVNSRLYFKQGNWDTKKKKNLGTGVSA